ncbi:MAG: PP2C family protein-serine/threonine phosphatase [Bacteroidetes bacterium]|nr:PP2C family protein-serine/threonine phosphatase [Bacteroidota bacterium]
MPEVTTKSISKSKLLEVKLASLLEVTKAINSNTKTRELLKIYESVLRNQLNVGKLVLYAFDGEWKAVLKFGMEASFSPKEVEKFLLPLKDITLMDFAPGTGELVPIAKALKQHNVEVVIPVFHKDLPLAYALVGDIDEEQLGMSASVKELNFIQTLTNILVVAIENKRLAKDSMKQAAIKKELEVASQMQHMLFPRELPNDAQLEMDAVYIAHQEIGGDYYDFVRINEQEVAFCIADVSGKGVSAALLMSNFQANLRILLHRTSSLADLVRELNYKVNEIAQGERFITLFIAKYNLVTKNFTYVNAGHNPPLLLDKGGSIASLKIGTTGLGMLEDLKKVKEGVMNIEPGTVLFCYTDGVVEQENENEEEFGVKRVKEILEKHGHTSKIKEINKKIIQSVSDYKGAKEYVDDIALLTCRIF